MGSAVQLIEENSLQAGNDGYEIQVRLNWYRSLPLSCVDSVSLSLDGSQVQPDQIYFAVNNHEYRLDELPEQIEEFWFVQDSARLRVHQLGKVAVGETHTIEAAIALRAPYIMIGPGKFLVNVTRCATVQTAKKEA
jgi:hypothetical protein